MKNIAILSNSLTSGGAERVAGLLSKKLSKSYNVYLFLHDCSVITYDYAGMIVDISVNGEVNEEETIREYKKIYKIDCAISFLVTLNCLNVRTRSGETVILSNRCSIGEIKPYPYRVSNKIKQWYGEADRIVSCSYGAKYDLTQYYGICEEIITPIYNFVDKEKIINNAQEPLSMKVREFVGDSRLILNVGRLDEQKNQTKLLIQFSKLLQDGYNVKLLILGAGYMECRLKELAKKLNIEDKVLFETYCKNPFPYYKAAEIMAFSTDYEGLPNVVLEAMTLGLPVVAVDCLSGPLELIKGSTDYSIRTKGIELCDRGILVEQADTDTIGETAYFAEGMKMLLDNPLLCEDISECEMSFMKNYDNEVILQKWIEVIENTRPTREFPKKHLFSGLDGVRNIIVYGAGGYGRRVMDIILKQNRIYDFLCFAVTDKSENADTVYDIPVYQIEDLLDYRENSIVVVGVSEEFEAEVVSVLEKNNFRYIFSDI